MNRYQLPLLFIAYLVQVSSAFAYDGIVEKKDFHLGPYTTVTGKLVKDVHVGYETYGTLNATKDNVILVTHHFSGNSHAAGKYSEQDKVPGYWNAVIGSGAAFDTDKYFVVSSDTLVNLNVKDPHTITTGPASLNPDTGKPYGMSFPVVGVRDFVQVQKALLDSLGVRKLVAVAGASGGAAQAVEWAAAYPTMVAGVIAVVPPGLSVPAYTIGLLNIWAMPIQLDPRWNGGNYYDGPAPMDGLAQSLKLVTFSAVHFDWAEANFGPKFAAPGHDPLDSFDNQYLVEAALLKAGMARAQVTDANSLIYTSKAYQTFSVEGDLGKIKAKVLFIPASSDMIFPEALANAAAQKLKANGNSASVFVLQGHGGHLDGINLISQASDAITSFLKRL